MTEPAKPDLPPPPGMAERLGKYILGFGVSFAIGLAPYLGKLKVPGFDALLTVIPLSLQPIAIPLSSLLMGVVAVTVQWMGTERRVGPRLKRWFKRTLIAILVAFALFLVAQFFLVVRIHVPAANETVSFVVGFSDPARPPCEDTRSKPLCVKRLTLDEAEIEAYWGSSQIQLTKLVLLVLYLGLTAGFGALVGLLVLKEGPGKAAKEA